MVAGLNLGLNIWRMATDTDDVVGGAMVTGSLIYGGIKGRMEQSRPSQIVLEQGLEVDMIWTCLVRPASLDIRERDEIEVGSPPTHPFINQRFRVRGVRRGALHPRDGRGTLELTLSRIERSRTTQ